MMKKVMLFLCGIMLVAAVAGCQTKKLAAEDIEVAVLYPELIAILKNPNVSSNSKEKYDAIRQLIKHVDFELTREAQTLDALLYHGDAVSDSFDRDDRTVTFNYQYGDRYVRLEFALYGTLVLRGTVIEK